MTWLKAAPLGILWALLLIPRLAGFVLNEASLGWLLVYLIPVALLTYSLRQRPLLLCLGIAALFVASAHDRRSDEISVSRGFFGVNRILSKDDGKLLVFKHGTTVHGIQLTADDVRNIPLSYYHRDSPIGQVFRAMSPQFKNVGAIGLGIGSVACYRLPGQNWTFFEIDPLVVKIAQNEKYFNYLSDCAPEARIVIGDGRLALAREQPEKYDMLIIDAFSSDAIPMHLMTREALALYFSRLAPGGLILFHISNLHLDLSYVLAALAHDAGVTAFIQNTPGGKNKLTYSSTWVILARSVKDLKPLATDTDGRKWKNLESRSGGPVWTDDFGDIIRTLRVWRKLQRFQLFN
jgi:spermidine synthase